MCRLGALEHVCRGFFCSSTRTCGVFSVKRPLLSLYLDASVPRVQTVEAFPRGHWTVVTFRHLFVKVTNAMCGLLRSLFRHSMHLITFAGKFEGCTLDRKQCLDFRRLVSGI